MALSVSSRASKTIRAVTLLAVAGMFAMPSLAKAQEETWTQTAIIPIPGLASFDISFVEVNNGIYLLADRSNRTVDQYDIPAGILLPSYTGNYVGPVLTSTGTVNNDLSGPNGVLSFLNPNSGTYEVWVGDGPQTNAGCPTFLGGVCSAVKVSNLSVSFTPPAPPKAVIATGGAARADELCHDPTDKLVLMANDAEADFKFGTPFITFISTKSYTIVAGTSIPAGDQWDRAMRVGSRKPVCFSLTFRKRTGRVTTRLPGNVWPSNRQPPPTASSLLSWQRTSFRQLIVPALKAWLSVRNPSSCSAVTPQDRAACATR